MYACNLVLYSNYLVFIYCVRLANHVIKYTIIVFFSMDHVAQIVSVQYIVK